MSVIRGDMKSILLVRELNAEVPAVFTSDVLDRIAVASGPGELPRCDASALAEVGDTFAGVEYIFSTWNMPELSSEQIAALFPSLEAVFYAAGSVKYFAGPFFERGVRVFSAAPVNAIPVAEYATAQIVLASKGFYRSRITVPRHFFAAKKAVAPFPGNYHVKIGILGMGNIGRRVVASLQAQGLEAEVLAYDPYVTAEECAVLGCHKASLDEVFRECDVVSNHMPDVPETRGILNGALFDSMKPTATFINTARGAQVIESDLAASMRHGKSRTAVLDVTDPGVIRPWNPLLRCSNVYITPHIAGSTGSERERLGAAIAGAFEDYLAGRPSGLEVDPASLGKSA